MVETLGFYCRGCQRDPWSGELRSHMPHGQKSQSNKQKTFLWQDSFYILCRCRTQGILLCLIIVLLHLSLSLFYMSQSNVFDCNIFYCSCVSISCISKDYLSPVLCCCVIWWIWFRNDFLACVYFLARLLFFYWRIIDLPYCVGFCHTSAWISHR